MAKVNSIESGGQDSPTTQVVPGVGGVAEALLEQQGQGSLVLRRFLHHKLAMISTAILLLIILTAIFLPIFWPYSHEDVAGGFARPSLAHPLGTNQVGKDMVAQILRGTQYSLLIAVTVSIAATVIGVVFGALAGYLKGFADSAISRLADLFLIVPHIAAAGILVRVFGGGKWYVVALVLSAFLWMQIARITRAEALSLSEREFVESARAAGAGTRHILFKHLIPNMVGTIMVNATLTVALAVLVEAALSFVGLGVQLPDTSLGRVILDNYAQLQGRPWLFFGPFLTLVMISLTINFIGDGLRDAFDPRQKRMKQ